MARDADGYSGDFQRSLEHLKSDRHAILDEIAKVIVGQAGVLKLLLAAVMARGHCLLMGVPGLAKTAMVKALGQTLDLKFKRIQFTPGQRRWRPRRLSRRSPSSTASAPWWSPCSRISAFRFLSRALYFSLSFS